MRRFAPVALLAGLVATALLAQDSPAPWSKLLDSSDGDDWPAYGRTYGEQHFSPLGQITAANVSNLSLAWYIDLDAGNSATQPIEVDGTLYFSRALSVVHAVDAATGKELWRFDSNAGEQAGIEMRSNWGIRGIAWWGGKVYTGTTDGRLIALDAKTGKQVWSVQTTRKGSGLFITGAPRAVDGKIVIGQGGGDNTNNRGYATAYDAESGEQLWRFHLVPGNPAEGFENQAMAMAAKTWTGEWWKWGGGGEPWNAFTYDADTNTVLIGTGNGFPQNQKVRSPDGGDNLFLCSMVALDADTGEYKWHYQFNPGETWDYNAAMDMELAELTIAGKPRKVVMTAPKNGFLYVIDRTDGTLISAEKIAKVTWASHIDLASGRPVETPGARYPKGVPFELWPSKNGAHSWMPMAYSPQTRLVYIPKREQGEILSESSEDLKGWTNGVYGLGMRGTSPTDDPLHNTSALLAWDPVKGETAWSVPTKGGWTGGVLATGGSLVFQGQLNGTFAAYDAASGKELWRFPAQGGIIAAPISYLAGGRQYVTVMVGMSTSAAFDAPSHRGMAFDYHSQKRRVLTFAIGGKASLPAAPAPFQLQAFADPDYRANAPLAGKGNMVYHANCGVCHGVNVISGGAAPDLRGSGIVPSAEAFRTVVHDGALVAGGMPGYPELGDEDLAAIRQYLRSRAAELR
ncbi:MAG: PQQ-dependent dehydrogenase, methanol/ethanol family [Novosphingobium sp.]|nr:PQQ-dependent dehydrogenase, methanol/ethanol family [Novosphingobium sp.]